LAIRLRFAVLVIACLDSISAKHFFVCAGKARADLRTPHTHYKRGTPLRIILRDGQHIYDQYESHGSGHIILRERGKIQLKSVKAVTIWKGKLTS
jgi:hypothetical protein